MVYSKISIYTLESTIRKYKGAFYGTILGIATECSKINHRKITCGNIETWCI
jgi:hypothetical protein